MALQKRQDARRVARAIGASTGCCRTPDPRRGLPAINTGEGSGARVGVVMVGVGVRAGVMCGEGEWDNRRGVVGREMAAAPVGVVTVKVGVGGIPGLLGISG